MRRKTLRTIALGVAAATAVALSGCAGGGGGGGEAAAGGTVTLWVRDYQEAIMKPLADAFNKSHDTKVKVTLVPAGEYVQKLGTAAAGNNAPDIASIDLVFTPYFASVGALADITDKVKSLDYADDLSPAHVAQGQYEGKTYSVPFTGDVSVLFYNKTLFSEAGLDPESPPKTHQEIADAAAKISALGNGKYGYVFSGACGGCNIFSMTPLIWASGGNVLNEDGTKALLDSPEVADTLQLYRDMWANGDMPKLVQTDNGPNAGTPFQEGKIGMKGDGTFFLGTLASEGKVDFGVTPLPGKDGGSASFAGGDNLSITSGSKNPDGAWEFLEWATGEEAQTQLAEASVLPIRMDLLDKIYIPKDPRYQVFADALAKGFVPYSTVENELFNDNNGIWATLIAESVFRGDIPAAQKKAQKAAQALLDEAND
jgi:multiple sugar transport system substrate-binding protein